MMYCGIDYSMTCPSITIGTSKDFSKSKTFYYTNDKKAEGKFGKNLYGMMAFPYEHEMERFNNIAEWAMTIISKYNVTEVCLEGYAMGAKGRVFHIAENTAILKHRLWQANIKYHVPSPTTVKKYFTGKGNANKLVMHESFLEMTNVDIGALLNKTPEKSPVSDVVDSFAMLCYGIDNLFE